MIKKKKKKNFFTYYLNYTYQTQEKRTKVLMLKIFALTYKQKYKSYLKIHKTKNITKVHLYKKVLLNNVCCALF